MNIVFAVKIFAALAVLVWITKVVAGPGLRHLLDPKDYRTAWWGILGTVAVSCFSGRVEIFFVILPVWVLILSNALGKHGEGRLPAYVLLSCISPPLSVQVQHIGPLNDLLLLNAYRILALFLLLPEATRLIFRRRAGSKPAWLVLCDVVTVTYAFYWLARHFSYLTISTLGREALGQMLDALLPYYVVSRACTQAAVRLRALAFLLLGATYVAFVGVAESVTRHALFSQLQWLYNAPWGLGGSLMRGSWLRAQASLPGPLPMASLMLFACGIWFALKEPVQNRRYLVVLAALVAGLLATYGRGAVLAAGILFVSVALLRRLSGSRYLIVATIATIITVVSWQAGVGDFVSALILSTTAGDATAEFNFHYREQLLSTSLALLHQSPWLGVPNFMAQMENLRQGEGIIDLVNTYLVVALNSGLFGIALVFTPYVLTLWREANRPPGSDQLRREGNAWLALTAGVLANIFSVSPVSIVQPIMIWTIAFALARLQDGRVLSTTRPNPFAPVGLPGYPVTDLQR